MFSKVENIRDYINKNLISELPEIIRVENVTRHVEGVEHWVSVDDAGDAKSGLILIHEDTAMTVLWRSENLQPADLENMLSIHATGKIGLVAGVGHPHEWDGWGVFQCSFNLNGFEGKNGGLVLPDETGFHVLSNPNWAMSVTCYRTADTLSFWYTASNHDPVEILQNIAWAAKKAGLELFLAARGRDGYIQATELLGLTNGTVTMYKQF